MVGLGWVGLGWVGLGWVGWGGVGWGGVGLGWVGLGWVGWLALAGWLAGWMDGWFVGSFVLVVLVGRSGWSVGRLVRWSVGWFVRSGWWLAGWLAGWLWLASWMVCWLSGLLADWLAGRTPQNVIPLNSLVSNWRTHTSPGLHHTVGSPCWGISSPLGISASLTWVCRGMQPKHSVDGIPIQLF